MLNPDQRELVSLMREALATLPERERRRLVVAMRQMWKKAMEPIAADLERRIAKASALSLAVEERIGHEPDDEELITEQDELRANEIFLECWRDLK